MYESVQYRFEEDGFDTVPDLITYYVGSGKSITTASSAKIQKPKNRLYPLSFYANKYELQIQNHESRVDSPLSNFVSRSTVESPPRQRRDLSALRSKKQRSLSLLPGDTNGLSKMRADESDGPNVGNCSFSHSLPRRSFSTKMQPFSTHTTIPRNGRIKREFSSPPLDRKDYANGVEPPPKPNRYTPVCRQISVHDDLNQAQMEALRKNSFYVPSGSDSGNGSGDSVQSCSALDGSDVTPVSTMQRRPSGVVIKNPKYYCGMSSSSSLTTLKAFSYDNGVDDVSLAMSCVNVDLPSAFDLDAFHTLLLPMAENKPLDTSALQGIHMLLMDSGSRILANHLTRADLELTVHNVKDSDSDIDIDYMCKTGIELSVLPHGHRHRLDLIERYVSVKQVA